MIREPFKADLEEQCKSIIEEETGTDEKEMHCKYYTEYYTEYYRGATVSSCLF